MSSSLFRYAAESQGMVLIFGLGFVLLMAILSEVARKLDCRRDVPILRALVSTRDEDDERFTAANEVHAISGTVVDPHLRHAATHRLDVAGKGAAVSVSERGGRARSGTLLAQHARAGTFRDDETDRPWKSAGS